MTYTLEEASEVLAETRKILAEDARRQPDPRTARAAATTKPPARPESFHDVIVGHQRAGKTLAQATRLAAIERPDLRADFVKSTNDLQQLQATVARADARRFRTRNR